MCSQQLPWSRSRLLTPNICLSAVKLTVGCALFSSRLFATAQAAGDQGAGGLVRPLSGYART